jgi:hypothetical protein
MSKGSHQRPASVSREEYRDNWASVFAPALRCGCRSPCAVCAASDPGLCCHGYFEQIVQRAFQDSAKPAKIKRGKK